MTAVLLSLAAALTWGLADFGAGLKSRRLPVPLVLLWVEGTGLVVVLAAILATGEPWPDGRTLLYSALAGVCGVGALGCFYQALSIGTMSIVAPVSATGVTLPVIVGIVSGDQLGALVAIGLAVTFCGVLLASREEVLEVEHARASRAALLFALAAAAGFGGYFAFGDVAADGSVYWLLAAGRITALPAIALLCATRGIGMAPPRADRIPLMGIALADLGATTLYALATTRGALAIVAVVGGLYPVATILLARGILGERIARLQAIGVATAMLGIGLVLAG